MFLTPNHNATPRDQPRHRGPSDRLTITIRGIEIPEWVLILAVGLLHGLIYLILVPPWQHYDEPTHFEHARRLASGPSSPVAGVAEAGLRRQLAASMMEHAFFVDQPGRPNLLAMDQDIWIGASQLGDPPLYYLLIAAVLGPANFLDLEAQLQLARLVSLLLYLATLLAAYGIVRELFPGEPAVRLLIPLAIALTPAFTDLMTAMNNDVAATLIFTLMLYSGVRLIRRGPGLLRTVSLLVLAALSILIKSTIWSAAPLALVALLISWRQRARLLVWGLSVVILLLLVVAGLLYFEWRDAAHWYRRAPIAVEAPTSVAQDQAVIGSRVLTPPREPDGSTTGLFQPVSAGMLDELGGKTITLGAWIWASAPIRGTGPAIWIDGRSTSDVIEIDSEPRFFAIQAVVPEDARRINLILETNRSGDDQGARVFYDGVVLVTGSLPAHPAPEFLDASERRLQWRGETLTNLARNASGEFRWLTFTPEAGQTLDQVSSISINRTLLLVQDVSGLQWLYRASVVNLFQSFWARFGWNQIHLHPAWYALLIVLSAIGIFGAVWFWIERWNQLAGTWRTAVLWLAAAGAALWLGALFRQTVSFWQPTAFIPSARYAYPAIAPTMIALGIGWYQWLDHANRPRLGAVALVMFFLVLDAASIYANLSYYAGR